MRTAYHVACILFLGCGIITENFQGCGQGIQNIFKTNIVYTFGFMLADKCLWRGFYLAVFKGLPSFGRFFPSFGL